MTDIVIYLSPEVITALIGIFILLAGIEKQDYIIGSLCCNVAGFIFLFSLAFNVMPNVEGIIQFVIMFIAFGIGLYKIYLSRSEGGTQ